VKKITLSVVVLVTLLFSGYSAALADGVNSTANSTQPSRLKASSILNNNNHDHHIQYSYDYSYKEGWKRGSNAVYNRYANFIRKCGVGNVDTFEALLAKLNFEGSAAVEDEAAGSKLETNGQLPEIILDGSSKIEKRLCDLLNMTPGKREEKPAAQRSHNHYDYNKSGLDKGIADGKKDMYKKLHTDTNGVALTDEGQFALGMYAYNEKKYDQAMLRFNLILLESKDNGELFQQTIWISGYTRMITNDCAPALIFFILSMVDYPDTNKEETMFYVASLLKDVKAGGILGFATHRYYQKAKSMFAWWTEVYPNSKFHAEGLFKLGQCCELQKDKGGAAEAYKKLIKMYPNTTLAQDAEKRLKALASLWPWD